MMKRKCLVVLAVLAVANCLDLKNGAYEDFVIKIAETVPSNDCKRIVENLETTLTSASQYLFSALDSRAYLRAATVLLPSSWPDSCVPSAVVPAMGEASDVTVLPTTGPWGKLWTQQSLGCGQPGDQIFFGYETLLKKDNGLGRSLVKEFASYRYGVFEEQGYYNDPIYPMCYYDDQHNKAKVTGCSDLPINDHGLCTASPNQNATIYNATNMVNEKSRTSIMFAAEAPSVSMFCDDGNHDRFAPTKHNFLCERRSVLEVIMRHDDFKSRSDVNNINNKQITDTTPSITYKRQNMTRYVFVIENNKDMNERESWSFLRLALRHWAVNVLPSNSEIGLVLSQLPSTKRALNISFVQHLADSDVNKRFKFASSIPYTPKESMQPSCLHCSIREAMVMLNERNKFNGPASNVIVVIAPGMKSDDQFKSVIEDVKKSKIHIATINYPSITRSESLSSLAEETGGVDYTVFENKLNVDTTLLSTYFELHNILFNIVKKFYSGPESDLPTEIHRREIKDDGRNSVTGSFMLEPNMGKPSQFTLFTYNSVTPLIKSMSLISPSQHTYSERNDMYIDFKKISLFSNISETGTWTYIVEPFSGNPQPHYLQVMATPESPQVPIVNTRFWSHRNHPNDPIILLAEVKYGHLPILGAKVEVTMAKHEPDSSIPARHKFELFDTGSGDPDITKGDGIYSRYFSASEWGSGIYTFEVFISDNGNTAYTSLGSSNFKESKNCCGSMVSLSGVQPISPFQRVLPKITMILSSNDITMASLAPVGRIGDLKAEIIPEDMKARLSWTSPDMAGLHVSRYEIKYAISVQDIIDNFETSAKSWEHDALPLGPGSETTFTLDMSEHKELLDKPLYFAIKAFPRVSTDVAGTVSNWVRVLVPSPPPPPTVMPTYSSNEAAFWPNNVNMVNVDPIRPSVAKTMGIGLELFLPIVIGLIVLLGLVLVYFCIIKKKHRQTEKSSQENDMKNSNITIIPSSPQNAPSYTSAADIPDPHQVGVPTSNYAYEDETKKRYSLVNQHEQQLIDELKQQQLITQQRDVTQNTYPGLSVISNSTINRNGHPLSPYNSWSASQLLHEHERRHSPLENMINDEQQMMNGSQIDGQSVDHMSITGHNVSEYPQGHIPPPVPPLPAFSSNSYPVNYNIYGIHQSPPQTHPIYQTMQRNDMAPFNSSLQGSMTSVNSGEKKRRNVTMV